MKLLNKINLMLILWSFYVSAQTQESLQEKFSKSKATYIAPCHKLYGNALVDCMDSLDDEMFVVQLYLLNNENNQRKIFFEKKLTTPEEYEKFYKKFKTDEQWSVVADEFSLEERAFFPNVYNKKQQEDDVYSRKLWRNATYVGAGVGVLAAVGTGSYGLYALYNYAYTVGAAAKAAELIAVGKAAVAGLTCEKAAATGGAIVLGAIVNQNEKNPGKPQQKIPS